MTVKLTAPVFGQQPGTTFTGPEEAWLVAEGYAHVEPKVALPSTGALGPEVNEDLTLAANREPADEAYDYDAGGVDNDPPMVVDIDPATGPLAGGTTVTIVGDDLTGVTGVTFGGVAGTAVTVVDDNTVTVVTPGGTAGAKDVVVTDPNGSDTVVGGFTYA